MLVVNLVHRNYELNKHTHLADLFRLNGCVTVSHSIIHYLLHT